MLARRWRGIRRMFAWYAGIGVATAVLGLALHADWLEGVGSLAVGYAVWDTVARSWRTLRLTDLALHPRGVREVAVTRHIRHRGRMPNIEVAGLWPDGVVPGEKPPLSVRVEDVGAVPGGGTVTVLGRVAPDSRVLLVARDQIVWPLRPVREGLRPRWLKPYPR